VTLIAGLVISLGAPFEGTAPLACDVAELLWTKWDTSVMFLKPITLFLNIYLPFLVLFVIF
jgi:hypothetical protein